MNMFGYYVEEHRLHYTYACRREKETISIYRLRSGETHLCVIVLSIDKLYTLFCAFPCENKILIYDTVCTSSSVAASLKILMLVFYCCCKRQLYRCRPAVLSTLTASALCLPFTFQQIKSLANTC